MTRSHRPFVSRLSTLALAAAVACLWPATIVAQTAASWLSPEAARVLAAGQDLRASSTGRNASLSLVPSHPAARSLAASVMSEKPDVVVEALFLWKKPAVKDKDTEKLAAYNVLRSIGSLTGIEYYSASRKTMRLFYESSTLIYGPDDRTPLPDRALSALPAAERLYARQKDLSFGDNVYSYDLSSGPDWLQSLSVNLTTMRYGIIPVAGPGDLRVRALVIVADDAVIFYAVSSAKATVIPGVRAKLEASFGNRAAAIYSWFAKKAQAAWAALP